MNRLQRRLSIGDPSIVESIFYDFPARTATERLERLVRILSYQRDLRCYLKWWKERENLAGQRAEK